MRDKRSLSGVLAKAQDLRDLSELAARAFAIVESLERLSLERTRNTGTICGDLSSRIMKLQQELANESNKLMAARLDTVRPLRRVV